MIIYSLIYLNLYLNFKIKYIGIIYFCYIFSDSNYQELQNETNFSKKFGYFLNKMFF